MDIETFNNVTGKTNYSNNRNYFLIRQFPKNNEINGKILLGASRENKTLFIKDIKYPDHFKVSNNAIVVGCNVDHERQDFFSQVLIFDSMGSVLYMKESQCPVTATAISEDGAYAAFAFAGDKKYLEHYLIYIIDVKNAHIGQVKPIPPKVSVYRMEFDETNSLKVHGNQ